MAVLTLLKRDTTKGHLKSVDEANDQFAVSGLVRTASGTASLYADANTTAITIGSSGTPTTVADDLVVNGEVRGPSDGTGIVIGQAGTGASTGSTIQLASLTTGERDDLIEADGMVVYNETVPDFQFRVNGSWVSLGTASDLDEQVATGTSVITRTLATYAVMTGMTITPGAGTWMVVSSTSGQVDKNSRTGLFSIFSNGVQVQHSEREIGGQANNKGSVSCTAVTTVGAGQAIDIRWRLDSTSGGPTLSVDDRSLMVLKVGT